MTTPAPVPAGSEQGPERWCTAEVLAKVLDRWSVRGWRYSTGRTLDTPEQFDRREGNQRWLDGHAQGLKDGRAEALEEVTATLNDDERRILRRISPDSVAHRIGPGDWVSLERYVERLLADRIAPTTERTTTK